MCSRQAQDQRHFRPIDRDQDDINRLLLYSVLYNNPSGWVPCFRTKYNGKAAWVSSHSICLGSSWQRGNWVSRTSDLKEAKLVQPTSMRRLGFSSTLSVPKGSPFFLFLFLLIFLLFLCLEPAAPPPVPAILFVVGS